MTDRFFEVKSSAPSSQVHVWVCDGCSAVHWYSRKNCGHCGRAFPMMIRNPNYQRPDMSSSFFQISTKDIDAAPPAVQEWFCRWILQKMALCVQSVVIVQQGTKWEYFCKNCGQLRFYPKEERPTGCGACGAGAESLVIDRPGVLKCERRPERT